jgi:hypothetical protein
MATLLETICIIPIDVLFNMLAFPLTDHTWLDVHTHCEPTLLHNKEDLVSKIQMIWCVVHSHGVSDMHVSACMDVCM